MKKHTPGPWSLSGPMGTEHLQGAEPWFWVSAFRTLHVRVSANPDGYAMGENEANAHLIVAAPDLLEALEDLADRVDSWNAAVQEIIGREVAGESMATQRAREVIRKARGES